MARTLLSILFVASTTYGYKYPFPYYQPYEGRSHGASHYRSAESSLPTGPASDYQERSYQTYQDRHAQSSQIHTERTPYGYNQRSQDQLRVAAVEDVAPRNGNTSYKILNSLPKTYPSVSSRRGVDSDSAVVFPGPTSGSRQVFTPQTSDDCLELGICENSSDYPHEYVAALLAKLPDANIRFNLDVDLPEIAQRGGHEQPKSDQSVELCKPDVRIIYPDKARTKEGKVLFIVNGQKDKVQGFRGSLCRSPGKPCNDLVFFPANYTASCEQKMMDRYMWALNDRTGQLEQVTVPIPSCCMCVLQAVK